MRRLLQEHLYLLHGLITAVVGEDHDPQRPAWSLFPDESACGWGVYWWRDDLAERLSGFSDAARLAARRVTVSFSEVRQVAAPEILGRGFRQVEITSLTPVISRCYGGTEYRTAPDGTTLASTISQKLVPGILSTALLREAVPCEIVRRDTDPVKIRCGPKLGFKRGWQGTTVIRTNGLGHWCLAAAAAGPGLGGWTAFGFGAVAVRQR
jgi:hypothetical protein